MVGAGRRQGHSIARSAVAAEVTRRISARKRIPPPYLGGYGSLNSWGRRRPVQNVWSFREGSSSNYPNGPISKNVTTKTSDWRVLLKPNVCGGVLMDESVSNR